MAKNDHEEESQNDRDIAASLASGWRVPPSTPEDRAFADRMGQALVDNLNRNTKDK